MGIIGLMWLLQTVHSVCNWYQNWLGWVKYGGSSDEAVGALRGVPTTRAMFIVDVLEDIGTILRPAIADSIMVHCFIRLFLSKAHVVY
jgi:hypothetical protein